MSDQPLLTSWKTPADAFRGKPFWCWNAKLEKDELLRQLPIFKEMGMSGVFMHSRTGLATEYLGDDWFSLIKDCADEAARLGMEAWLYDEDRWPSGSAGGLATTDPRHCMKYLRLTIHPADSDWTALTWPDQAHFVAAFAAQVDGLELGTYTRTAHGVAPAAGLALLLFTWEIMAPHSFYNGGSYLDTLSRKATEHFLDITHDRYAEKCGDRIGGSIKGIFTDEPHRGFVMCDTHGQPGPVDTSWITSWTGRLPAEFQAAFGHDLLDKLPELFLRKQGEKLSRVKWEYMELIQRMFLDNWAAPMRDRCKKLGMTLTGHVLHEDSLGAQAVPCGSMMRYYEYLDWPGVDVLGLDNRNFWIVKQLSSVARQLGKPWLLSELYGCSGWQMGFDGHKRIGDWQALYGINIRCHHLSWYSMAGESKRDYPASIFFQSAWWREYEKVETYFSRLHVLMQNGRPHCDVLVINPVESLWAQIHPGWATWLETRDPELRGLDTSYQNLFHWLTGAQIDFDYGDEDHLARFGKVRGGDLNVGEMSYGTVIVNGMETIRGSTLRLLEEFQAAGGNIIFVGTPPQHVDARPANDAAELAARCRQTPAAADAVVQAVRAAGGAARDWQCDATGLLCQVRRDGDKWLAVLMNPDADRVIDQAHLRLRASGKVLELDCLHGEVFSVASKQADGWTEWETSFGPLQERAFVIDPQPALEAPARPLPPAGQATPLAGPFDYELDEPNICVLDFAAWRVAGGDWQPEAEILRIEKALAEHHGVPARSGQMVQPWASKISADGPSARLELRFTFEVVQMPEQDIELLLEQPSRNRIRVNDREIDVPENTGWFIDPCFRRVPLPAAALRVGSNTITLECDYKAGHDLEAIYLLGSFGVSLQGRMACLGKLPAQLATGDVTTQGLPFYSGKIRYHITAASSGQLALPAVAAACVTFRAPQGDAARVVPWAPFECAIDGLTDSDGRLIVELALTRRNTFGPLHLVPVEQLWIGPDSFRSDGENWTDDYQLIPAGLLAVPEVRVS